MSSPNNNVYNNQVYPLSLYLHSLSNPQDIIHNPYNHQLTAATSQWVSAVPDSLINYMAFNSSNVVSQQDLKIPPEVSREVKKAVKKDRHSKIRTAQGLRDRRVRLSIEVAREFFDLQDMLGFDKASKTLDWLLKKSRKAINELVQETKLKNDDKWFEGVVEEEKEDGDSSFMYGSSPEYCKDEVVCEIKKAKKRKKKSELSNISSKGKGAKSKGKAKEITIKMTYENLEAISEITQSENMDPFKSSIIFNEGEELTYPFYKEAIKEFENQESIFTKTNLQTIMGKSYNQQDGKYISMDQGSSSNYNSTIVPQNLDFDYDKNPFIDQPFCDVAFSRGFP